MSRDFNSTNRDGSLKRMAYSLKWATDAYRDSLEPVFKDVHFVERQHYGVIDYQNNSIIPNSEALVSIDNAKVFAPVADSISLMRLNLKSAIQRGSMSPEGSVFGNMSVVKAYQNPKLKYGEYLGNILRFYNESHIPNVVGIINIPSYETYVKHFLKFILENTDDIAITLTRWNTSYRSNILDTGLAFSYLDIPMDADQQKIDEIVDNPNFQYMKNLAMNMGFCISNRNPNILIYDIANPANNGILAKYGNYNLPFFFNNNYIKTCTIDMKLLISNINIYYNKYAQKNSLIRVDKLLCDKVSTTFIRPQLVNYTSNPFSDIEELEIYTDIRSVEEGKPFNPRKVENIKKKAKNILKRLDKASAIGYINDVFKDQVWNKDHGYHDLGQKLKDRTL